MNNEQEIIELGIVGIKNKGVYDAETAYERLNVVTYQGSSYCALKETIGNLPTDTEYWQLYASKGDTGPTGATGATGATGPAGPKGDPSGTPLAAASVNDMTDTTKVYVNTTDGKWYYYDGANWTAGGIYQSTTLGANAVDVENLSELLQTSLNTQNLTGLTVEPNYFIAAPSGQKASSNNYSITGPISLEVGDKLEFYAKGYNTGIAILSSEYIPNKNEIVIQSEDSDWHTFTHTALYKANYYISSYNQASNIKLYRQNVCNKDTVNDYTFKDYINNIIYNKTSDETFTENKFIQQNGRIFESANYDITDYIEVMPNEYITLKVNGTYLQPSGSACAIVEFNANNEYITGHAYSTESELTFKTNDKTKYVRYTISPQIRRSGYNLYYSSLSNEINNIKSQLNDKNNHNNILRMFSNITCIGDSLTESAVFTSVNTFRDAYKTYPDILGIMTGANVINLSHGGDTATMAWNRWNSSITSKTNQLTIIYLGTNEGLTDTVDVDCVGNDYTLYANTNTGNYGKLIKKSLNVGSRVILVKCYAPTTSLTTINSAIEHLAERFNVAVVDNEKLTADLYHYYPDLTGTNNVHYNDLGYEIFTERLVYNINNLTDTMKSRILPV